MKFPTKFFSLLMFILVLSSCRSKKTLIDNTSSTYLKNFKYHKHKKYKKLDFDFYKSAQYKNELPLIIYVHGGGFSGGSKDDDFVKAYCLEMAKNGFAVAAISYRLTMKKFGFGCNTDANLKIKAFNAASEDISLATNYIVNNSKKFGVNTNKIILVGSSAGAEAILNLAYVYENKILPKGFKYAGLIAMAGAITTLDNITTERAIPTQFYHGVKDKLVPFDEAPHHYCSKNEVGYLPLYGSKAIAEKLKSLNTSYYLYTVKNGDHSWNSRPMYQCKNEILDFLYYDVLQQKNRQTEINK